MSGLSQYQSVFRIAKQVAPKISPQSRTVKRNRQSVSCLSCRARKLKCDRQVPCMSCSKRGEGDTCMYSNGGHNARDKRDQGSKASEAQLRLQKLEEMVTCLMQKGREDPGSQGRKSSPHHTTVDKSLEGLHVHNSAEPFQMSLGGHLDIQGSETSYLGSTHWATVLENIRDIQDVLQCEEEASEDIAASAFPTGLDIVLDTARSLTLTDICNPLPSRIKADNLLSVYFNARHLHIPFVHTGKFMREYESFWVNPSSVSLLWISMLFSSLYIGSRIEQTVDQEFVDRFGNPGNQAFLTSAGQALVTGGYHKARPYSVEAVLLYGICKYMQKDDPDTNAWTIIGVSARLALRMGYHRDPRHLTNISPFEGEMRRRTFFIMGNFDLLLSFQAGLPAIIHDEECDTEPPSNLFDTDFDEYCKELPPSRPPTDPTPMLYYCYKGRLSKIFRRVIRHALSLRRPSYEETLKLDRELDETRTNIPPSLRMRPLSSSFTDPAYLTWHRLTVELMYQKNLCVLHRNYLNHEKSNPAYDYSRDRCTNAALEILRYQAELHFACQPDGQFHKDKWMLSNLTLHDFLLAAMISCLALYETHNKRPTISQESQDTQVKIHDALKLSYEIWTSRRAFSRDARRASNVLAAMLSKVPRPHITAQRIGTSREMGNMVLTAAMAGERTELTSAGPWSTHYDTSRFATPNQNPSVDSTRISELNYEDPLNTIFNEPDNVDWAIIDQCLLGQNRIGNESVDWQLLDSLGAPPGTWA